MDLPEDTVDDFCHSDSPEHVMDLSEDILDGLYDLELTLDLAGMVLGDVGYSYQDGLEIDVSGDASLYIEKL